MKKRVWRLVLLGWCVSLGPTLYAQETIIRGKVTDAGSGDPLPFVNVYFKGTQTGATTDFDGNFLIRTTSPGDSLVAAYVGYHQRSKAVKKGVQQTVNFQLDEAVVALEAVVVRPGENPAFPILKKMVRNKPVHDKRRLNAYEYDTYTKIEIDVDNISDKFKSKKIVRKISQVLDSVERIAGEDGKPILPMMISESVSKVYYRDNPVLRKEFISRTKITGVGVEDGTTVTQMVGSSFQEYNFYQNWLSILVKEFVSPLADGGRIYYEYDLMDSLMIGGHYCYKIDFYPRSPQELAFTGTMWLTKEEAALKRIDATVGRSANLNFIEKIRIQQELAPVEGGAWLPVRNRILIDVSEITANSAGMLAKFYTSNEHFVVGKPHPPRFYEESIELAEDSRMVQDESVWDTLRHEPLSETEKNVYRMIDTLKNIPVVRTYTDIMKTIVDGYYKAGSVKVGPYLSTVAWNSVEGTRLTAGFKSTMALSENWVYAAQVGYGFTDQKVKYMLSATRVLDRKDWTTLSFRIRRDVSRIGVDDDALADNPIFLTALRWGNIRRGYYSDEYRIALQREVFKGFTQRVAFRHWTFDPTYPFAYYVDQPGIGGDIASAFQASELMLESRYARDETFLRDDNERISLSLMARWPVFSLRYTHGFKDLAGSDFSYDKLRLTVSKRLRTGPLGIAYLTLSGEYIFNRLPYPLLNVHLGNPSPFYSSVSYNLMNFGEFISDRHLSLRYQQYLEGFLLNRIPLIRKLNWRLLGTANVIAGALSQENREVPAPFTISGEPTPKIGYFTGRPYVELGYGVENIFRFLRVDFIHRMTYLKDRPDARRFGILFSVQFQL